MWETRRFGQFTLSTRASYLENLDVAEGLLSPELQSSLTLSWHLGNHSASAITNYFDGGRDIGELDVEAINELMDDVTTVDLQYGYTITTGPNNRAVISFGIKNIFDQKTAQILNSSTRILDQNGRVAYGSIKYQF